MANEKHFDYSAYSGIYQEYAEDVVQISQENLEKYRQDGTMREANSIWFEDTNSIRVFVPQVGYLVGSMSPLKILNVVVNCQVSFP